MRTGESFFFFSFFLFFRGAPSFPKLPYMQETKMLMYSNSLNFNIVSKGLGSNKMSYYINEAANDLRDLLLPTIEPPKAKL